ncbi:type VI secretion system-associated protein TagO [Falsiroseomonas tokyonensis]|uniref:Type VI secretion system-associated protein TagO n=1 Tax=Falsiroseomonas tokyonensis TaxID=430521 RepID=A0ABV7BYV4_9PROT
MQAGAQEQSQPSICRDVQSPTSRLACYDALFPPRAAAPTPAAPTNDRPRRQWNVTERVDPLTQQPTVTLSVDADTSFASGTPRLYLRCRRNRTEAYIFWYEFLGPARPHSVTWRASPGRHVSAEWDSGQDGDSSFAPAAVQFIRTLIGAETLFIQAASRLRTTPTVEFSLAGLSEAIGPLQRACGWR